MSEPIEDQPIDDQPEYVPDPVKEKQAKAVHFMVSMMRLLGVILVMLGRCRHRSAMF